MAKERRTRAIEVAPLGDDALALVGYKRNGPFKAKINSLSYRALLSCTADLALTLAAVRDRLAEQGITLDLRPVSPKMRRTMREIDREIAERNAAAAGVQ